VAGPTTTVACGGHGHRCLCCGGGGGGGRRSQGGSGGGGGGGGGNDTVSLTTSNATPAAGSSFWISANNTPANAAYTIVWDFSDNAPFFNNYRGVVHTGTTTVWGTAAVIKVVPNRASGRTAYMEMQCLSGGNVTDSNTLRLDIP